MTTQDPELSAALGWPGGISDPVLDRTRLLQMVAALRLASQQALEALEDVDGPITALLGSLLGSPDADAPGAKVRAAIASLRAALAQEQTEPDISRCPQCNGPADNGFDRSFPPSPYLCTKCMAEPVEVAERERVASQWDGCVTHQLDTFGPVDIGASIRAGELVEAQQAEPVEPVAHCELTQSGQIAFFDGKPMVMVGPVGNEHHPHPLYTAPPQRKLVPLTEEEIYHATRHCGVSRYTAINIARAVEKASREKNHGKA